jgi:hypothetical protein
VKLTSYIFGIVAALLILVVVIELLRRRHLRERHAVWWFVAGLLALVAGVFPSTLTWAASLVGIAIPINLVFFVSIAILFLVCLQFSSELTRLESKTRKLAERVAIMELELSQLKAKRTDVEPGASAESQPDTRPKSQPGKR